MIGGDGAADKPDDSQLAYFRLMTKSLPLHVFDRASFS
jgi:hypothetical protein